MEITRYQPPLSVVPFLQADKFTNFIVGPVGSTKTTASIIKILHEASRVAPCKDGVRRSRCAVIRNTRQMLWDTTIPDFLKWYPDGVAGVLMKTESKFLLRCNDVECEVLFRGLDDANDVRRLLSLQLTFGMMDEFREIHPDVFNALTGRLGRYPDKTMNGVGACDDSGRQIHKVWGATNPPDSDTFWEQMLSDPPDNCHVTMQPSGLSPEADWVQYLPDGYYDNLCEGKSEDWVDVYVHGKFGRSLSGQPVFRCFNRETHVAKAPPNVLSGSVLIGVDAGLNPSATLGQLAYDGRLVIHDAITGNEGGMGALRFVREKLKPLLANKFPGRATLVIIDPAAFQRAQTDERSVADIFKAEGFTVKAAKTNSIAARLAACESYMTRTVGDKPALVVSPEADLLIKAWAGKYRYKINTKGERDDKPEKSHPWSDLCFVAGTPVLTPSGYVPVEALKIGDTVISHEGVSTVSATGSHIPNSLIELTLSNGAKLTCTPNHPFAVDSHTCFLPADVLTCKHNLVSAPEVVWANGQSLTRLKNQLRVYALSAVSRLKRLLGG